MFADIVSHRLSNGVEARADGLYLNIHKGAIIDWWFDVGDLTDFGFVNLIPKESGGYQYKWPWKHAAKHLTEKPQNAAIGNAAIGMDPSTCEWYLSPPDGGPRVHAHTGVIWLDRIVGILVDTCEAFETLFWCVHELGGSDDEPEI